MLEVAAVDVSKTFCIRLSFRFAFPPEFYLIRETKIGPELRLTFSKLKIRSTSTLNLTLNDLIIVLFS